MIAGNLSKARVRACMAQRLVRPALTYGMDVGIPTSTSYMVVVLFITLIVK
jgi:hypothetical protein